MHRLVVLVTLVLLVLGPTATFAAQGPQLTVPSPAAGAVIQGSSVTVRFEVGGLALVPSPVPLAEAGKRPEANRPGEGHLHLMLDLLPLVVWERGDAYTFENVPPGEHQLMVELVENDHSSLSTSVMRVIRFRTVAAPTMPPTLPRSGTAPPLHAALALIGASLSLLGLILRGRRRTAR